MDAIKINTPLGGNAKTREGETERETLKSFLFKAGGANHLKKRKEKQKGENV